MLARSRSEQRILRSWVAEASESLPVVRGDGGHDACQPLVAQCLSLLGVLL